MVKKRYEMYENYNDLLGMAHGAEGQYYAGATIGILAMEMWYPKPPGNVVNANTFKYPVAYKLLEFGDPTRLMRGDPDLLPEMLAKGEELVKEGVRAIVLACGYFAAFQKEIADALDVPVYSSSLIQIPMIKIGLRKKQKIGVIVSEMDFFRDELLESVGIDNSDIVVIGSMNADTQPAWSNIRRNRTSFNNGLLTQEVVDVAEKMVRDNPDIGAILLECSDLPPYSYAVQRAVNLPVFDFVTMINWLQQSVCQKQYFGSN